MSKTSTSTVSTLNPLLPPFGGLNLSCWKLLWLPVVLVFAAGCASTPHQPTTVDRFTPPPASMTTAGTPREAANIEVGREIYAMFLADRTINYRLVATVDNGIVTLGGVLPVGSERNRISDQIRQLKGVTRVQFGNGEANSGLAQRSEH